MNIIKEHTSNVVVLRVHLYAPTLGVLELLFQEAKKDFPRINPHLVRVVKYGGRAYRGTYGIEFSTISEDHIPETYRPIAELEEKL